MAKLTYLGHSAFYIEGKNIRALVDPFLSGNPTASEGPDAREELDYIFVTHAHGDHLGDTVEIAKRTGASVFATNELAQYLANKGLETIGMHIGGRASFPFGRVKLTPAHHGSSIFENGKMVYSDVPCGFLIEVDGKKIYHAGDTGLAMDMKLLAYEEVDVAILPIGGFYVMDAEDAARAVGFINPIVTIPIHYDTFPPIKADPAKLAEYMKRVGADTRLEILKPGETLEV